MKTTFAGSVSVSLEVSHQILSGNQKNSGKKASVVGQERVNPLRRHPRRRRLREKGGRKGPGQPGHFPNPAPLKTAFRESLWFKGIT